jgi:hypothetical protein
MKRYLLLLLLCFCTATVRAQNYTKTLNELLDKSDEAMYKHNLLSYLKIAQKIYGFTLEHRDTTSMITACVRLVDFYILQQRNDDSAGFYLNKGLYWSRLKKDLEHESDLRSMIAARLTNDGKYVEAHALYQQLDVIVAAHDFKFAPYFNDAYAKLLFLLNDLRNAIARQKLAIKGFERMKDTADLAPMYCNIGGNIMTLASMIPHCIM